MCSAYRTRSWEIYTFLWGKPFIGGFGGLILEGGRYIVVRQYIFSRNYINFKYKLFSLLLIPRKGGKLISLFHARANYKYYYKKRKLLYSRSKDADKQGKVMFHYFFFNFIKFLIKNKHYHNYYEYKVIKKINTI